MKKTVKLLKQAISDKKTEIKKVREHAKQYFGMSTNGNPKVIQSDEELRSINWYKLEMELLGLHMKLRDIIAT